MNIPTVRYENMFQKLPIVLKKQHPIKGEIYSILDETGKKIGSFTYEDCGYVSSLELNKKVRRKKAGADALLTLREFLIKRTKDKGLDYFEFHARLNNGHNLKRLYNRFGMELVDTDNKGYRFVGIVNPLKKEDILEELQLSKSDASIGGFIDFLFNFLDLR